MANFLDIERIGRNMVDSVYHARGAFRLLVEALKRIHVISNMPVRQIFYKQLYFTGIEALGKVSLIGLLIGIVIITQVSNIVGSDALLTGKVLVWAIVRELGPLLSAVIIIARSSTAVAAELGVIKVSREGLFLFTMGIDPFDYLIVPRVVGIILSVLFLSFYFQVSALAGGLVLSSLFVDMPFLQQTRNIFMALGLYEIVVSLMKSLAFGFIIAAVSCYHGFRVGKSITEVPQVTAVAVMHSIFMVFIFDGIITLLTFL